jgi:peptide/nickel transport system ATP-binding protein
VVDLLRVENLSVEYYTPEHTIRAVNDVSFSLPKVEAMGIVGESGCGKSTLALALLRILPDNARIVSGRILLEGQDLASLDREAFRRQVRWKKMAMIFQGAMNVLNPMMKVGKQLTETMLVHERISKTEARRRAETLMSLVGLSPERLGNYPHELSGGIKQRIVIAMALSCNPRLLIADEPTTALDVITQSQIFQTINNLRRDLGVSVLLISHDIAAVSAFCDTVSVMYAGEIVESNQVKEIVDSPLHPYTKALLATVPSTTKKKKIVSIPGNTASLANPPKGCRFHPRCPYVLDVCKLMEPEVVAMQKGRVACHLYHH